MTCSRQSDHLQDSTMHHEEYINGGKNSHEKAENGDSGSIGSGNGLYGILPWIWTDSGTLIQHRSNSCSIILVPDTVKHCFIKCLNNMQNYCSL